MRRTFFSLRILFILNPLHRNLILGRELFKIHFTYYVNCTLVNYTQAVNILTNNKQMLYFKKLRSFCENRNSFSQLLFFNESAKAIRKFFTKRSLENEIINRLFYLNILIIF